MKAIKAEQICSLHQIWRENGSQYIIQQGAVINQRCQVNWQLAQKYNYASKETLSKGHDLLNNLLSMAANTNA